MHKKLNPWDIGPTELIQFALECMHGGSEFDKRLSFLVLDIGVETLFKTFLTIPDTISHAQTSMSKRREAVSGSFHALVNGVREAIPERAASFNLEHVQYYHDIRNTLYHQGNTVAAVRMDQLSEYASLAVGLLRELLDVDLSDQLTSQEPQKYQRNKKSGPDPVVDSVEVKVSFGHFQVERLKSQSIRVLSQDTNSFETPVKPFLRAVIEELSLPIAFTFSSGKEKNTRTLGKNVIDEIKRRKQSMG